MDWEAFRLGGAHLAAAYPSGAAMEDPNQSQNQGKFMFGAKAAPLQLFGSAVAPVVGPAGYCNYTGNTHLPVININQARTSNIDAGTEKLLKLQMSLNDYHQQNAERLARVGNPSAVSTGLRLSYEDDEHNSPITSGSASMISLPTTVSSFDDLMTELDKENREISYHLRHQIAWFEHYTTRGRSNTARTAMEHRGGGAEHGLRRAAPPTLALEGVGRDKGAAVLASKCAEAKAHEAIAVRNRYCSDSQDSKHI